MEVLYLTLQTIVGKVKDAYAAWKIGGEDIAVHSGPWCRYCPCIASCPAKTGLVRVLASSPSTLVDQAAALTPASAAVAYHKVKEAEHILEQIKHSLKLYAETQPINLGEGWWYGQIEKQEEKIDAGVAYPLLKARFGDAVADAAVKMSLPKSAIEDIARAEAQKTGMKRGAISETRDAIMSEIRSRGGIKTTSWTAVQPFRRKGLQ
jgi:hypothetical protein